MLSANWPNILRVTRASLRAVACSTAAQAGIQLENLSPTRSLIRIQGDQVQPFLQGLITNDLSHVSRGGPNDSMYTMFLNKAGRVLYDVIIYRAGKENSFLIECDKRIDADLRKHMLLFRIRKKIDIDIISDEQRVWTVFRRDVDPDADDHKYQEIPIRCGVLSCYSDPRLKTLGVRLIASTDNTAADIERALPGAKDTSDEYNYAQHRYRLGVGEGIYELPPEKCFPFEANCDYMHGISFHKGCYLGQEFTARTYHTGVIRKRLMPIALNAPVAMSQRHVDLLAAQITGDSGEVLGKLRGVEGSAALGLLRIEQALKTKFVKFGELCGVTSKPNWWPTEAPRQTKL